MRKFLLCLITLTVLLVKNAQSQSDAARIKCQIESVNTDEDTIFVHISIRSLSVDTMLFYKPVLTDVNYGFLSFRFLDKTGRKKCEYAAGEWGEVDRVMVKPEDCDLLVPGGTVTYIFPLEMNLVRCYAGTLKKASELEFSINHNRSIFAFSNPKYKFFTGHVESKIKYSWSQGTL